jgi:hypothetical protein
MVCWFNAASINRATIYEGTMRADDNTRRNFVLGKLKTIGKIAATAAAASVLGSLPTRALAPPCFLKGTKIRTATGERNVEELKVGDMLPTMFGGERPIQWMAEWRYKKGNSDQVWKKHHHLVRISRSALAPNVPRTDLYVTPGHAIFIDGVLIPAGALVNGSTIEHIAAVDLDELHVFNIKLESHDVIFADEAPCETLLRVDETTKNYAEYQRLFGTDTSEPVHCAPVFCKGGAAEIRSEIASLMSPWFGPHKVDVIREQLESRARALV